MCSSCIDDARKLTASRNRVNSSTHWTFTLHTYFAAICFNCAETLSLKHRCFPRLVMRGLLRWRKDIMNAVQHSVSHWRVVKNASHLPTIFAHYQHISATWPPNCLKYPEQYGRMQILFSVKLLPMRFQVFVFVPPGESLGHRVATPRIKFLTPAITNRDPALRGDNVMVGRYNSH